MTTNFKAAAQIAIRFIYSESVNFTLPIQKKPLPTGLSPFSVKRPGAKGTKDECERALQR
jgi:hypothetical protein